MENALAICASPLSDSRVSKPIPLSMPNSCGSAMSLLGDVIRVGACHVLELGDVICVGLQFRPNFGLEFAHLGLKVFSLSLEFAHLGLKVFSLSLEFAHLGLKVFSLGLEFAHLRLKVFSLGLEFAHFGLERGKDGRKRDKLLRQYDLSYGFAELRVFVKEPQQIVSCVYGDHFMLHYYYSRCL